MTDDSEYIKEPFEFHPCDTPRGMLYYNLKELTTDQQHKLNEHKVNIIRNNQKYLQEHPEVKIITSTLLKAVLLARPKFHIHQFLVDYLMDYFQDIKKEVEAKVAERLKKEAMQKQRVATIAYLRALYEGEGFEEAGDDMMNEEHFQKMLAARNRRNIKLMCRHILDDMINKLEMKEKHRVHIQVNTSASSSDIQLDLQSNTRDYDSD